MFSYWFCLLMVYSNGLNMHEVISPVVLLEMVAGSRPRVVGLVHPS